MNSTVRDVVIIGGGISGAAAAYELARAGASVTLVEKGALASMASGWTLGGVRQSGRHPAEMPLARAAVRRWMALAEELDADVEYRQDGNLRLARTPDEIPVISAVVEDGRRLGLELEFLPDTASVRTVAPALSERVLAASFCPTDGHANPAAAVAAFAAAAERHGAVIRTHTAVTAIGAVGGRVRGVQTTAGPISADVVVAAAGVHTDHLLRPLGLELPIAVAHVSVVQTVPLPPLIGQVLGVANADFAGRQEVGGRIRATGGSKPWAWPAAVLGADAVQPPARGVEKVIALGRMILPALAEAGVARVWGGLIDQTPDGLPVIERTPEVEGLLIAAGFSGHGFCLGPITGRLIGDLVTEGRSSLPLGAFRRSRLAGTDAGKASGAALHG